MEKPPDIVTLQQELQITRAREKATKTLAIVLIPLGVIAGAVGCNFFLSFYAREGGEAKIGTALMFVGFLMFVFGIVSGIVKWEIASKRVKSEEEFNSSAPIERSKTPPDVTTPRPGGGLMTFKKVLGWICFLGGICGALSDVTILLSRGNMESPFWNYSLPWTLIYLAEDVVFIWGGWLLSHPVKKTNMRKPLGWTMIGIVILNIIHSCYNIIISNNYSPLLLIFPVFAIIQILSGWWLSHPLNESAQPTPQSPT